MQQHNDSPRPRREHLVEDDGATTPPTGTRQAQSDERDRRTHDKSENELPSSQEKNPVPRDSTRR